jgi:hypothetical protein
VRREVNHVVSAAVPPPARPAGVASASGYQARAPGAGARRHHLAPRSMIARISSTRQAVIRGPSLTGLGNRPDLTPAHQVDLQTGMGPRGAMIRGRRTRPVFGS